MVITTTLGSVAESLAGAPTAAAAASEAAKTDKTLTFMQWGNYIASETGESRTRVGVVRFAGCFELQRTQKVEEVLLLGGRQCLELVDDLVGLRTLTSVFADGLYQVTGTAIV
jgi:hypothetical protein